MRFFLFLRNNFSCSHLTCVRISYCDAGVACWETEAEALNPCGWSVGGGLLEGEALQKWADELWILNTCKDSRTSNLHEFSMWWNVINDKSRPFCLISVTTSDNKYHLSDGITGNVSCHFAFLIVIHVTLDMLGRGWHSQWLPVEIISPLWALRTRSFFKRGSDDSLFWWRTAQTSFESGLHFTGRSQKLWSSCCVKRCRDREPEAGEVNKCPCYPSLHWSGSPRKSCCYDERLRTWILFAQSDG